MAIGFFAVFDDIAMLLDDAAAMSKAATKKTQGVVGDDISLKAQRPSGFVSQRELPILWAVTKGSFKNKFIILPIVFFLHLFAPWVILFVLMLGGIYLAHEGTLKVYEYFFPDEKEEIIQDYSREFSQEEILIMEKIKIKSAIITDFIFSVGIIIIALGTVTHHPLQIQILAVAMVSIIATIGVYGFVAVIIRLSELGLKLTQDAKKVFLVFVGKSIISVLPKLINVLVIVGTIAMLLIAGGIFTNNISQIHDALEFLPSLFRDVSVGLLIGAVVLGVKRVYIKLKS